MCGRGAISHNRTPRKKPWRLAIPIQAKKWSFTRRLVEDAPAHAGVYALWRDNTLLHLGCAHEGETIRDKLLAHFERAGGQDDRPTHYSWEISGEPRRRAWELAMHFGRPAAEAG